jgi:hypothetical protein
MPNTFVDAYTYSKIVALAVFQDIGVSALAHQRILNVLLLGFDLILILVSVKTTRKRLCYYQI